MLQLCCLCQQPLLIAGWHAEVACWYWSLACVAAACVADQQVQLSRHGLTAVTADDLSRLRCRCWLQYRHPAAGVDCQVACQQQP